MRDIGHDAILFDMYYYAKVPSLAQTNGKVEIPPVNDGTPQFRKFYINNLVCEGAGRAMLIRGLPEMSIKDIYLENITIKAQRGADIIEAQNINMKDVRLECADTKPLFNIENSRELTFSNLRSAVTPDLLFGINGDRCKQIILKNSNLDNTESQANYKYGADKSVLTIMK